MTLTAPEGVISAARLNQEIIVSSIAIKGIITPLAIDNVSIRSPFQGFANIGTFHQVWSRTITNMLFHVSG